MSQLFSKSRLVSARRLVSVETRIHANWRCLHSLQMLPKRYVLPLQSMKGTTPPAAQTSFSLTLRNTNTSPSHFVVNYNTTANNKHFFLTDQVLFPPNNKKEINMSDLEVSLVAPNGKIIPISTGLFINNEFVRGSSSETLTSIDPA